MYNDFELQIKLKSILFNKYHQQFHVTDSLCTRDIQTDVALVNDHIDNVTYCNNVTGEYSHETSFKLIV